jgi:hypothetical protein
MQTPASYKSKPAENIIFTTILALAVVILPLVLGQKIIVSPLLLIAVAVMPNLILHLIPATEENHGDGLLSRVFYMRIVASVACAFLLLAIYRIAYFLGSLG